MNPAAEAEGEEQFFWSLGEISELFAAHLHFRTEGLMRAYASCTFLVAVLTLATAIPRVRILAANAQVRSGVDRLYVID
jgi:hypothetical protein